MNKETTLTPEEARERLDSLTGEDKDFEIAHHEADKILCAVLRHFGQHELVRIYGEVGKWYA